NTRAISELLGITTDAAEKRLQRARQTLGKRMEEALGETIERQKPLPAAVKNATHAIIAAPVAWKPIATSTTGFAVSIIWFLTSWKLIAAMFVVVALLAGGVFFRSGRHATPIRETENRSVKTHSASSKTETTESDVTANQGFWQRLSASLSSSKSGPTIRVIADGDSSKTVAGAKVTILSG